MGKKQEDIREKEKQRHKRQGKNQQVRRRSERLKARAMRMNQGTETRKDAYHSAMEAARQGEEENHWKPTSTTWPPMSQEANSHWDTNDEYELVKILRDAPFPVDEIKKCDYHLTEICKMLKVSTGRYYTNENPMSTLCRLKEHVDNDRMVIKKLLCGNMSIYKLADQVFKRSEEHIQDVELPKVDGKSEYRSTEEGRGSTSYCGQKPSPKKQSSGTSYSNHVFSDESYDKMKSAAHRVYELKDKGLIQDCVHTFALDFCMGCPNFATQVVNYSSISEEELLSFLKRMFVEFEKYGHKEFGERQKAMA